MAHLSPERLIDLAEGATDPLALAHVSSCAQCRATLDEITGVMASLREGADIPEPSPMFWDHLSSRVIDAVRAERTPPPSLWRAAWQWQAALAIAAAIVVIVVLVPRSPNVPAVPTPSVSNEPAARESSPIAFDESLALLADLAADVDWDSAGETLGPVPTATDQVFQTLDPSERAELHRLLNEALKGSGV